MERTKIKKQDIDLVENYLENEKKSNITSVDVKFRVRQSEDILRFLKFKKQVLNSGETMNNALLNVFKKYLEDRDQKKMFASLKNDIFYSFNKAIYARMSPFSNHIINQIKKQEVLLNLIDKKLNLVLNMLAHEEPINSDQLNNPSTELLKESEYFKLLRSSVEEQIKKQKTTQDKRVKEIIEQQKKFDEYDFNSITDEDNLFSEDNDEGLEEGIYED